MRTVELASIRASLVLSDIIALMRDALVAQFREQCETPMPMHLAIAGEQAEIHIKSSYRQNGRYFVLKVASTFPANVQRGLSTGNGMMLICSAETGAPVALLCDEGHLTDVRTAAVAAMTARELKRSDSVLGILGAGIQARLQAQMHAAILPLEQIVVWGRDPERTQACVRDIAEMLPHVRVEIAASPAEVAARARLIVTATASRAALIDAGGVRPGTHLSAVGSDSVGKQELDSEILRRASLILADSRRQCEKLGELQHAPSEWNRAREIGAFCLEPEAIPADAITVADFTGLGVEDLYIAEYCYERSL